MVRTATQKGRLIIVAGSVAAAAAGALALRADLMVSYGFGKVFLSQKAALPFELAASDGPLQGEVGDEWLAHAAFENPAPFDSRLAVGDRVTITGRDGRARNLEVVDLKAMGTPILKIAAGAASVRLLRVTFRILDPTEGDRREFVRFFIDVEEPKPATLPRPQDPLGRT